MPIFLSNLLKLDIAIIMMYGRILHLAIMVAMVMTMWAKHWDTLLSLLGLVISKGMNMPLAEDGLPVSFGVLGGPWLGGAQTVRSSPINTFSLMKDG